MNPPVSARVPALLALAAAGLSAGLASGHPELAVLVVPFLLVAGVGLALAEPPQLALALDIVRDRIVEGDSTPVTVTLHNRGRQAVDVAVEVRHPAQVSLEPSGRIAVHLRAGKQLELSFAARAERWGAHTIGPVVIAGRDRLGTRDWRQSAGRATVRAFPREQQLRELVWPLQTQPFLGTHVSRGRGDGIEFADVRPFVAGDRVRHVNWRVTARRGSLYVTERHPDRSSDLVLLLDTFAEARDAAGGTLDRAVRAAASVARVHLARRDRVALADFGGTLHWLEPAFGTAQLYRIIDALLSSELAFTYMGREVDSIPRRLLPPAALIVAISPLLDDRSIRLITDLRTRRYDVTVIEVSPLEHAGPRSSADERLAYRLWRLQREALRARLQRLGVGVVVWKDGEELSPVVEEVNEFRRSARRGARA